MQNTKGIRLLHYPKVGIYVGGGASHSWLWFVELLENIGLYDLYFLHETDIGEGGLGKLDILLVGGGDTFAIAESLGENGANALRRFIGKGGTYIGSCAGAYLLLDLSGPPFDPFSDFTKVKMANISKFLPECNCLPTKFYSSYNDEYVIHPVRESVVLKPTGESFFRSGNELIVPLYGGPSMVASKEETVIAHYSGFTADTLFLAGRELAQEMFIGKAAVIKKRLGKGTIWLFGPHFEHPRYHEANRFIAETLFVSIKGSHPRELPVFPREEATINNAFAKETWKALKRELSNARIMALGLESESVYWVIGRKSYEPEKIRVFLESIWCRLPMVMQNKELFGRIAEVEKLSELFSGISKDIKALIVGLREGGETTPVAERIFAALKRAAAHFLEIYFRNRYGEVLENRALPYFDILNSHWRGNDDGYACYKV